MNNDGAVYDVVVIGGALSGAATATLLLRNNPGLNLLIPQVKKSRFVGKRPRFRTGQPSLDFGALK
jgi:flavin-dependent dehydrogenase